MDLMHLELRILPIIGQFPSSNDMKSINIYFPFFTAETNYYKST